MGLGILPFLIQWVALNHLGRNSVPRFSQFPPKSHWELLSELQQLPEDEIEDFLPQICNILLDRENEIDYGLYEHFEQIITAKCANCLPFGIRVSCLLKAASTGPADSLFSHVLPNSAANVREDRLRRFQDQVEAATANGYNLPQRMRNLRAVYFDDFRFMTETLTRLGSELKLSPPQTRTDHLRSALSQFNSLIYSRMLSRGSLQPLASSLQELMVPSPAQLSASMPEAAAFSLHLPIQRCGDHILRLLRVVESACEVLPSKERCPYLLVVEVLTEGHRMRTAELYSESHDLGVTIEDVLTGRVPPFVAPSSTTATSPSSLAARQELRVTCKSSEREKKGEGSGSSLHTVDKPHTIWLHGDDDGPSPVPTDSLSTTSSSSDDVREFVDMFSRPSPPDPTTRPSDREYMGPDSLSGRQSGLFSRAGASQEYGSYSGFGNGVDPSSSSSSFGFESRLQAVTDNSRSFGGFGNAFVGPSLGGPHMDYHDRYSRSVTYPSHGQRVDIPPSTAQTPGQLQGQLQGRPVFRRQPWKDKKEMIRRASPFGNLPGWDLRAIIVKSGDDLRKEVLAMQVVRLIKQIFEREGVDVYIRPYEIVSTGRNAGYVEFVEGAQSIDSIKKALPESPHLRAFFEATFGPSYSPLFGRAVDNFVRSLAGYSLVTYLLQVKDRHNANILIEADGHMTHIDYGFILGDSPGFNLNFENAPFKLTREYVDLLGGVDSAAFKTFEDLFVRGFFALQRHNEAICALVELFYGPRRRPAADALHSRLMFARSQTDVLDLVRDSFDSWRTKQYDWYQQRSNNIMM